MTSILPGLTHQRHHKVYHAIFKQYHGYYTKKKEKHHEIKIYKTIQPILFSHLPALDHPISLPTHNQPTTIPPDLHNPITATRTSHRYPRQQPQNAGHIPENTLLPPETYHHQSLFITTTLLSLITLRVIFCLKETCQKNLISLYIIF